MPTIPAKGFMFAASLIPMGLFAALSPGQDPVPHPDFAAHIAPIFRAHCSPCHTGTQASGGLSLESFEALMKGDVVKKGASKESVLMERILGTGGQPQMPLGFKPLSDHDLGLIKAWIDQGANPPSAAASKAHWAFVAPKRPALPPSTPWTQNPIDNFIWARLQREHLKPSPPADKITLIRRVTFDLTGLPPTPSEVDAFVRDTSPNAYEKVVDRLLANPHYGERMALPWLDAARFADSNGFQQDGDTFQYVWRDWVVKSLNANMPFDEFTIEQLAGDLLPHPTQDQLVATAFNRNHMLNGEGGAIPEEQRNVGLFDRVDTTSATWLGLTMGCCRCHDHKYDPLTQRDYYSMMAYFNRVPETGVPSGSGQYRIADPWIYAGSPAEMVALARLEKSVADSKLAEKAYRSTPAFTASFESWARELTAKLALGDAARVQASTWSEVGTFAAKSFEEAFDTAYGPEKGVIKATHEHPEWIDGNVYPFIADNTANYLQRTLRADAPTPYLLSLGSDDGLRVWLNGKEILTNKITRGVVPDSDRVTVDLPVGDSTLLLKVVNGGGIGGFYFRGFPGGIDDKLAALVRSTKPADRDQLQEIYALGINDPELLKRRMDTEKFERQVAKLREGLPRVMVMSDAKPRTTHVLHRGNYEEPLEEVHPAPPASLPKLALPANRLGLARWMVSPSNPLTSRVQVNRAWTVFFGRGLVRTEENFGVKGEPPTHPELLDWLAVDFREHGWNVKRLHKLIVMSNTYRQSSKVSEALLKRDPANILYARAPRFRLPSMILRDTALAASGLLNPAIGGKPVYPYQPKGIWDGLAITLERDFTYPQSKGADNHRRSLYTFWRRTVAPGNMFDASSRQVCTIKQTLTSTPLHALTMLNDVTWVEAGRALALAVQGAHDDSERLREAFRRVCSRRPEPDELAVLKRALNRSRLAYRMNPGAARQYIDQGDEKLPPLDQGKTVDLAAMTAVCVAIFNLDEAMTRE